jgi:O-antigen/teichoic acid export membrane protein
LIIASLVNLGISLITTALIARALGPELYGKYTFGLTYILLFSVLANFGIETLFIRESARDKENIARMIMDIMHLRCVLAILTTGVIAVSVNLLHYPESTIRVVYILSVGLFFQILYMTVMSVYRSLEEMSAVAFFSIIFRVITAVMIVTSIYLGMGLMGIVWTFTVGNVLIFFGAYIYFYKNYKILHFRIKPRNWIVLVTRGFPFYLSALLTMVYYKINILMLSKMQGELEIGFYMAAAALVETLYFIPEAVNNSLFPAFSRIYGHSLAALEKTYSKMVKYVILIAAAVCVGCLLVGDKILHLIYGEAFSRAVPTLNVLIFFWTFIFFSQVMSSLLFSIKREHVQVKVMGMACVINIILNYLFIGAYGFIGSAYALVITELLVVLILAGILWGSNLRYVPDWSLLRLTGVLLVMVLTVKALEHSNVVIEVIAGAASYLSFLFVMRVFDREDIMYLRALIRKEVTSV